VTFPDAFLKDVFGDADRKYVDILLEKDENVRKILEDYYREQFGKKKYK
jgi:hypothetical protein